ncbi:MAG: trimethylamine methyltransferase family protein [Clostridia bacterium]|nr:trimethylamine methyltransferase family protein [Clostridia bacterium]
MKTRSYDIERNIRFEVLSAAQKEEIHEAAIRILEDIGMRIGGAPALAKFAERGLRPGGDGTIRIPRSLVQWALDKVPHELVLYNRDGREMIRLDRTNRVYFGTHSDMTYFLDWRTNTVRETRLSDIETMNKICSYCENIDFALSVGIVNGIDPRICAQVALIEACKYNEKVVNFSTNNVEALQDCIDILDLVAGGHENFVKKPFAFNYCEPIPPLTHPAESTEKLRISAENGLPVVYMPYCMMGGTAPMDRPTTLAQCFAEILAGLVISQLFSEGAPFIAGSMPSIFDMRTTIGSYAAPEFHLMIAASSEMADYYNLPFFGTAGCSDAKTLDAQAASEISYQLLSTLLSRANLIHDVGLHDHCLSVSPATVVLANELINAFKSYVRGVSGPADLQLLRDVGPGGHHLNEDNTLDRFYEEVWYPRFFSRAMVSPDESPVMPAICDWIDRMLADNPGSTLPQETLAKLDALERRYFDSVR